MKEIPEPVQNDKRWWVREEWWCWPLSATSTRRNSTTSANRMSTTTIYYSWCFIKLLTCYMSVLPIRLIRHDAKWGRKVLQSSQKTGSPFYQRRACKCQQDKKRRYLIRHNVRHSVTLWSAPQSAALLVCQSRSAIFQIRNSMSATAGPEEVLLLWDLHRRSCYTSG